MDASELLKRYAAGKTVFFGVDLSRADLPLFCQSRKITLKAKAWSFST
jgi:hypothetical protein